MVGASFKAGVGIAIGLLAAGLPWAPASALEVVLKDVAADRVERQRHYVRGEMPLAGTPDLSRLDERLKELGLAKGRPVYIRVFKAESELELWMQNDRGTFTRLATYPICHWTGTIGPKLKEGDKQSPEGFYSVGKFQTRLVGRWRRAFNVGFPNLHDQLLSRTGSYILIHGGCSSVGCFAMTDQVQNEIYELATAALGAGQERFQVHIFPFRMTEANLARFSDHEWAHTWADLKPAFDSFERTRIPPRVALCGVRYKVADGLPGETGGVERRLPVLKPVLAASTRDTSVVVDADGRWMPPPCQLEDEDRRQAATEVALPAASATTSSASDTVAGSVATPRLAPATEQPEELSASSAPAERHRRLSNAHVATPRSARRPEAGSAPVAGPAATVGGTDGFGTATFGKARDRVMATGG
ncbi:MAG: murein L,D-transpeptidase family protein [Hyphomicrobiaceae bacterium]